MNIAWTPLLTDWTLRPLLLLVLIALIVLYLRGRRHGNLDKIDRPLLFLASLLVLVLARMSPLNSLASTFLFAKVTEHLLLISVFPALGPTVSSISLIRSRLTCNSAAI